MNFRVKRYLLFYLAVGFFYGVYCWAFDLLFCFIDYGSKCNYEYPLSFIFYSGLFFILYFFTTLPLSLFYNALVNYYFGSKKKWGRYIVGVLIGITIGYSIHESGWSLYYGQYRALKNIIVFGLMGLSLEVLRTLVVQRKIKKAAEEETFYSQY